MFESGRRVCSEHGAFHSQPSAISNRSEHPFFFVWLALSAGRMEHGGAAAFWSKRDQLRNGTTCPVRGGCGGQSAARKLRLGHRAKWADLALNTSPARPSVMPLLPYVRRALPGPCAAVSLLPSASPTAGAAKPLQASSSHQKSSCTAPEPLWLHESRKGNRRKQRERSLFFFFLSSREMGSELPSCSTVQYYCVCHDAA
ncbi:hypothetical protein ACQKWADRAFT_33675 [Trichoderma austrokoningii]